jgi:hypothetical protein
MLFRKTDRRGQRFADFKRWSTSADGALLLPSTGGLTCSQPGWGTYCHDLTTRHHPRPVLTNDRENSSCIAVFVGLTRLTTHGADHLSPRRSTPDASSLQCSCWHVQSLQKEPGAHRAGEVTRLVDRGQRDSTDRRYEDVVVSGHGDIFGHTQAQLLGGAQDAHCGRCRRPAKMAVGG